MSAEQLHQLTQAQRDRLAFVELRLRFLGDIRRQDLVERFGIQTAAATRDLTQYKLLAPGNMAYSASAKAYLRGEHFLPLFDFSASRVLAWLSEAFGDAEPSLRKGLLPTEHAGLPVRIDLDTLSVVTRAIHQGAAIEVAYRSLSSGLTTRQLVPFALANSGLRWHIRAHDRRSNAFRDFVLGRIDSARLLPDTPPADHERWGQDDQWTRITELELVPHPANVQHPDTIEAEYGMEGGVLKVRVRAAMAGYLLRRWNVDCTGDHSLKGSEYHLSLRNRQALYGIENLMLAPGYRETDNADEQGSSPHPADFPSRCSDSF